MTCLLAKTVSLKYPGLTFRHDASCLDAYVIEEHIDISLTIARSFASLKCQHTPIQVYLYLFIELHWL